MDIPRKLFAWGGLAVALLLLFAFLQPLYRQGEATVAGNTAPDFSLTLANKPIHLSDLRGKVVVLNFWATWCPPCVEETPALNRLQQRIASRGGVVLGVSADSDPALYEKFLKDQKVEFPTYRDPDLKGNLSQIALNYGTSMYPETYIIDSRGKIARKVIGPQEWDSPEMVAYLDTLLSKG
jgi:cytochrome c biogenesis protein CcmG/thiol:disulfide interchange protein DsbE